MSSGIAIDDECKDIFADIKKIKKYRYIVYYIKDLKSITVEILVKEMHRILVF